MSFAIIGMFDPVVDLMIIWDCLVMSVVMYSKLNALASFSASEVGCLSW